MEKIDIARISLTNFKDALAVVGSLGAISYATGFIILRTYLLQYGVSDLSLLAPKYIGAGILYWLLVLMLVTPVFFSSRNYIFPILAEGISKYLSRLLELFIFNCIQVILNCLSVMSGFSTEQLVLSFAIKRINQTNDKYLLFLGDSKAEEFEKIFKFYVINTFHEFSFLLLSTASDSKLARLFLGERLADIEQKPLFDIVDKNLWTILESFQTKKNGQRLKTIAGVLLQVVLQALSVMLSMYWSFSSSAPGLYLTAKILPAIVCSAASCNILLFFLMDGKLDYQAPSEFSNLIGLHSQSIFIFYKILESLLFSWYLPLVIAGMLSTVVVYSGLSGNKIFGIPDRFWAVGLVSIIFLVSINTYATHVYPLVSPSLGGGNSVRVQLIGEAGDKNKNRKLVSHFFPVQRASSQSVSIPLCLMHQTEKSYFILFDKKSRRKEIEKCAVSAFQSQSSDKFQVVQVDKSLIKGVIYNP